MLSQQGIVFELFGVGEVGVVESMNVGSVEVGWKYMVGRGVLECVMECCFE